MSVTPPPLTPDLANRQRRERGWVVVIVNQFALPGMGSIMAGRRVGWLQLVFSLTGVVCMTAFLVFAIPRLGDWLNPPEDERLILAQFEEWRPWLMTVVTGMGSFAIAWVWALKTSARVMKGTKADRTR